MAQGVSSYYDLQDTDYGATLRVHYSETYETASNKSTVSITKLEVKQSAYYGFTHYLNGTITINGSTAVTLASDGVTISALNTYYNVPATLGSVDVTHNSDGSKSVAIAVSVKAYKTGNELKWSVSGSKTVALTTIPRKSSLSVSNGTLGTEQTLTVTRESTSFTHTITATCGSASTTICSKSSSTSIKFTPPYSWASQNTTGTSVSVTYKITTYNGSTSIGSNSYTKTCSIPSTIKPNCSITVTEATSYGAYIKGLSQLKIAVKPTLAYGSEIASYSVTANGSTYDTQTVTTSALKSAGEMIIAATVKDKRGRSDSDSTTITVLDKSTLSVSNGTLGTAQTLKVTRQSTDFTHTITYKCGTASGTVCTKSKSESISFTPPIDLASQNTTGTSVTMKFTIQTYIGLTAVGSATTTSVSMAIPSSVKPSCSLTVSDAMGYLSTYGGYVQGQSKLNVNVTATKSYGSAIASYKATANGSTYTAKSFITDVLEESGSQKVTATVKDNRGRTSDKAEATINVLAYSVPKISKLSVSRCDEDGMKNDTGSYAKVTYSFTITSLSDKNGKTITLKYKKTTDSTYTSKTLTSAYSASNATYIFAADDASSYDITLEVKDSFATTKRSTSVSTASVIMHFKADGTGMGIGKISEKAKTLDLGWDIELNGKNVLQNGEQAFASCGYGYCGQAIYISSAQLASEEELNTALDSVFTEMKSYETKLVYFKGFPSTSNFLFFGILAKSSSSNGTLFVQSTFNYGLIYTKVKRSGEWQPIEAITLKSHPVGSIFMATESTSPASRFGGTWERLSDVILVGASDTFKAGTAVGGINISSGGGSAGQQALGFAVYMWKRIA